MHRRLLCWAAASLCIAGAAPALARKAAPPLQGRVLEVPDANHVRLQPASGSAVLVRLAGIDAPDLCQSWGPDARAALQEWLQGREVQVRPGGHAGPGVLLGTLMLDGVNINARLVAEGHAWSQRGRSGHGPYLKEERVAHSLARGLFGAGGAVLPRDYRLTHAPCRAASAS